MYASSSKFSPRYDDDPPSKGPPPAYGIPVTPQHPGSMKQYVPYPGSEVNWSTGLCECSKDCSNCCMTCWCPCVTFGKVAEIVDRGSTSCGASGALYALISIFTGCGCIYSCFYRTKMRQQFNLGKRPCNDCLIHFWCECCALCQEYRELENRGFDMSLGWHGNIERQQQQQLQQGIPMAPPLEIGMTR